MSEIMVRERFLRSGKKVYEMTKWMNLTRIGKYGRQIVKKRSRNDIILDRIRKQDTENMI